MAANAENAKKLSELDQRFVALLKERVRLLRNSDQAGSPHENLDAALNTDGGFSQEDLTCFLRHVDSLTSRVAGETKSVSFLGPIYSYSYLAAIKHFGLAANLHPVTTISAGFEEVARGQSDFAVVPIENSTDGRIVDTLGMFAKSPARICGEVLLPIHHCLLANCGRSEIVEVQSKPQAISQCRQWLAEHLPHAKLAEVSSTATAAKQAANTPGIAAIASEEAGIHHGLQVVDKNIEDNPQNLTRFAVIGNDKHAPTGNDKTSLMFQLEHRPGALASAMVLFQQAGVNLTWIESFPMPNAPAEYLFFVELEGHAATTQVEAAIEKLRQESPRLEVLGSYPKGV